MSKTSLELNEGIVEFTPLNTVDGDGEITIQAPAKEERAVWDSKIQFLLSVVAYAVGLGNVWRFPYLCQQNGGGAFLIPYFIMLIVEGIPLFYMEMCIGQRLQLGSIGVWNKIHPYLGGVGISSAIVSFLVALYYNAIIGWCIYYFAHSFQSPLPWADCPVKNGTVVEECEMTSSTSYFWYRETLDITGDISTFGGIKWKLLLCLLAAWLIVYFIMMKGIKSSGKVVYFTATFPYIVLIIFFVRAITLKGSDMGLIYMFTPQMNRLSDPTVWLDAATQVFYSFGLAFGSLIAFASYNPPKNNCKRDVLFVSVTNAITALFACIVVFAVLGFKAYNNHDKCLLHNRMQIVKLYPEYNLTTLPDGLVDEMMKNITNVTMVKHNLWNCNIAEELNQAAEGTGLAFIVFTQAIIEFPGGPFWAVIFFLMLMTLGLGSMFGTLEGVITSIFDMKLFLWLRKEILAAIVCGVSFLIGLIFVTGAGEYWIKIFDTFGGTISLVLIALFEMIGVSYIYGCQKFLDDIYVMTGDRPGWFWQITWRFISPIIIAVLLITSIVQRILKPLTYNAYNFELGKVEEKNYPWWGVMACTVIVCFGSLPIPVVAFLRFFNIIKFEADIPESVKRMNTTASTQAMINHENESESDSGTEVDASNGTS